MRYTNLFIQPKTRLERRFIVPLCVVLIQKLNLKCNTIVFDYLRLVAVYNKKLQK